MAEEKSFPNRLLFEDSSRSGVPSSEGKGETTESKEGVSFSWNKLALALKPPCGPSGPLPGQRHGLLRNSFEQLESSFLTVVDAYRESRMKKQKVHSLTGRITPDVMLAAFKTLKRNRGAAGVDKVSIQMFEANLADNLRVLMQDLKNGSFEPKPLRRVFIPKNETEYRPLGIPTVRDRVAQEVIRPLLAPIFEPLFHQSSFAYIRDRNAHQAGFAFVRYADDFVVVCPSTKRAEEARAFVESVLADLGLTLSPSKTKIVSYGKGYPFLGFMISSRSRRMRPKSLKKFKDKIRELTRRKHNFEAEVIVKLNRVIGGTARYFATSFFTGRSSFHKLDSWIRMRLRCMKFKRKSRHDNHKLRVKKFTKLGLLTLESFCHDHPAK